MFIHTGCNDMGIRIFECVAKNQFIHYQTLLEYMQIQRFDILILHISWSAIGIAYYRRKGRV